MLRPGDGREWPGCSKPFVRSSRTGQNLARSGQPHAKSSALMGWGGTPRPCPCTPVVGEIRVSHQFSDTLRKRGIFLHPAGKCSDYQVIIGARRLERSFVLCCEFAPDRHHFLQFNPLVFGGRILSACLALPRMVSVVTQHTPCRAQSRRRRNG